MKVVRTLFLTATTGACVLVTSTAFALGPVDVEVAARVGGGTNPGIPITTNENLTVSGPNALGFGLGGRVGASFHGVYAGLSFMDYLGASEQDPNVTMKTVLYGVELGGNVPVSILTLRPELGLGNFALSETSNPQTDPSGGLPPPSFSVSHLYVEPEVTGLLSFGLWIVGADVSLLWVPTWTHTANAAFTTHGQVGIKF